MLGSTVHARSVNCALVCIARVRWFFCCCFCLVDGLGEPLLFCGGGTRKGARRATRAGVGVICADVCYVGAYVILPRLL
jgi:hypothetical protein